MRLKFVDTMDSTNVLTQESVREDLVASIEEMETNLNAAREFLARLDKGTLQDGDSYLSHTSVMENGYDRTGPVEITVEEVED
jgi:hypothetical protein